MILGIIIGIAVTVFLFIILWMYLKIMKGILILQQGVLYLVEREYEFEQEENKALEDLEKSKQKLNTVYNN